jgi:hypothetical protein
MGQGFGVGFDRLLTRCARRLGGNGPILLQKSFGDHCRIVIRSR